MQTTRVVFLMLIFALAATAAVAQTCGCGVPAVPAPAPDLYDLSNSDCAGACPAPCPTACPGPWPTCLVGSLLRRARPPRRHPLRLRHDGCARPSASRPCGCAPRIAVPSCAIAAGFGGGPLDALQNAACGCDFDKVYLESMYPLHADIIALATEGENRACRPQSARSVRQDPP